MRASLPHLKLIGVADDGSEPRISLGDILPLDELLLQVSDIFLPTSIQTCVWTYVQIFVAMRTDRRMNTLTYMR